MPSPVAVPARAGHYVELATGKVNFYCNCGARAHDATLRFIQSNANRFAMLTPQEVKDWQGGKLQFAPPAPQQLELPLDNPNEPSHVQTPA